VAGTGILQPLLNRPTMPITVHLVESDGTRHTLGGNPGQSLMRVATDAGIDGIKADCGGCMTCATCHVIVDQEWAARLPPPSPDEDAMLEMTAAERQPTSRLSCQIVLAESIEGIVVAIPETQY